MNELFTTLPRIKRVEGPFGLFPGEDEVFLRVFVNVLRYLGLNVETSCCWWFFWGILNGV